MLGKIDAHLCQGGNIKGLIRKYEAILCSLCGARKAVDLVMAEKDIDNYNKKKKKYDRHKSTCLKR